MASETLTQINRQRIRELSAREQAGADERTLGSRALYERARKALARGVPSSYQLRDPWPIYLSHGAGSRVWDVDGIERLDFHNGFGSMVQGHAHAAITAAVGGRAGLGTHLAGPAGGSRRGAGGAARRRRRPPTCPL